MATKHRTKPNESKTKPKKEKGPASKKRKRPENQLLNITQITKIFTEVK